MKLTNLELKRTWRFHGGIFLGLRMHFPCNMYDPDTDESFRMLSFSIGLISHTINFDIRYAHHQNKRNNETNPIHR